MGREAWQQELVTFTVKKQRERGMRLLSQAFSFVFCPGPQPTEWYHLHLRGNLSTSVILEKLPLWTCAEDCLLGKF